jgi:DNA invertase Pin-like site-specific DNA recombinase
MAEAKLRTHLHAMISARAKAALAAAKACGQTLGTPRLAAARVVANAKHKGGADTFAHTVAPFVREAQAAGAQTLRAIAAALNRRGVTTPPGGRWEAKQVSNVLRRIGIDAVTA